MRKPRFAAGMSSWSGAPPGRGRDLVEERPQVILLPGAVLPPNCALDVEIDGILRSAEASRFDRFHLVGYSGGGASSLAFAAKHPERLRSLALLEPAWAGNEGLDPAEEAVWARVRPDHGPPATGDDAGVRAWQPAAGCRAAAATAGTAAGLDGEAAGRASRVLAGVRGR